MTYSIKHVCMVTGRPLRRMEYEDYRRGKKPQDKLSQTVSRHLAGVFKEMRSPSIIGQALMSSNALTVATDKYGWSLLHYAVGALLKTGLTNEFIPGMDGCPLRVYVMYDSLLIWCVCIHRCGVHQSIAGPFIRWCDGLHGPGHAQ